MKALYVIWKIIEIFVPAFFLAVCIYGAVGGEAALHGMVSDDTCPRYIEGAPDAVTFPININTATLRELTKLQGIGDSKAREIIAYREENGSFTAVDELLNVNGIGESTLKKIREFVTI